MTENVTYQGAIPSEYSVSLSKMSDADRAAYMASTYQIEDNVNRAGYLEAIYTGLKTSTIGTLSRLPSLQDGLVPAQKLYELKDPKERNEIYQLVNYDEDRLRAALNNADTFEDVKRNAQLLNDDRKALARVANANWTVGLASGIVGTVGDPITLASLAIPSIGIPARAAQMGKIATMGTKVAMDSVYQIPATLASNYINSKLTGTEQDIWGDIASTLALSTGFTAGGAIFRSIRSKYAATHKPLTEPTPATTIAKDTTTTTSTPIVTTAPKQQPKTSLYDDVNRFKQERDLAAQDLKEATSNLSKVTNADNVNINTLERHAKVATEQKDALGKKVVKLNEEVKGYTDKINANDKKLAENLEQLKNLEHSLTTTDPAKDKASFQKTQDNIRAIKKQNTELRKATKDYKSKRATVKRDLSATKKRLQSATTQFNEATKNLANRKKLLAAARKDLIAKKKAYQEKKINHNKAVKAVNSSKYNKKTMPNMVEDTTIDTPTTETTPTDIPLDDAVLEINRSAYDRTIANHDNAVVANSGAEEVIVPAATANNSPKSSMDRLANLMNKPLGAIDFKSYIVGVRNNPRTPDSVRSLIDTLFHFEEGIKGTDGHYRQYISGAPVHTEVHDRFKVDDDRFNNRNYELENKILKKYGDNSEVWDYIYRKLEGYNIDERLVQKYSDDADIDALVSNIKTSYQTRAKEMDTRGITDNLAANENYAPLVLDSIKVWSFIKENFKDVDAAKQFLAKHLVNGVYHNPKNLERFYTKYEATLKEEASKGKKTKETNTTAIDRNSKAYQEGFKEWLQTKANEAALGYLDQNRSNTKRGRSGVENYDECASGFKFFKERMPWNTSYADETIGNFSLNSLRVDPIEAHRRYRARTTGILTDYDMYQASFDEVQDKFRQAAIDYMKANGNKPNIEKTFYDALTMYHRASYGMLVAQDAEAATLRDAFTQILKNLTFMARGTYMALNSYMELSHAVRINGFTSMLKLVPFAGKVFDRWVHNGFSKADLDTFRGYISGQTLRPLMGAKTTVHQNLIKYSQATESDRFNRILGRVTGAVQVATDHSPASYLMRAVNTQIDDVYETYALKELIQRASDALDKPNKGFFSDVALREMNISKSEFNSMLKSLRKFAVLDKNKNVRILQPLEKFGENSRNLYIMRRLVNYAREEVMQRRNIDDLFMYEKASGNVLLNLAMQFKAFCIQSYRKRFLQSVHRAQDEEGFIVAQQLLISAALSGFTTLGTTYVRGLGLSEEDKGRYYERTLGVNKLDDLNDPAKLTSFLYRITANRMSELSYFALLANTVGIGTGTKTTANSTNVNSKDNSEHYIPYIDVGKQITDIFPVINTLNAGAAGVTTGLNLVNQEIYDDFSAKDRLNMGRTMKTAFSGLVPTLPVVSNSIMSSINDAYIKNPYY